MRLNRLITALLAGLLAAYALPTPAQQQGPSQATRAGQSTQERQMERTQTREQVMKAEQMRNYTGVAICAPDSIDRMKLFKGA